MFKQTLKRLQAIFIGSTTIADVKAMSGDAIGSSCERVADHMAAKVRLYCSLL